MFAMINVGMGSWSDERIAEYAKGKHLSCEWFECGTAINTKYPWLRRLNEFCKVRKADKAMCDIGSTRWAIVLCSREHGGLLKAIETGDLNLDQLFQILSALEKSPIEYHVFLQ